MEQLKVKWGTDLEEILQCPVCLERPKNSIFQCKGGHHICNDCRLRVNLCPMCKMSYNGSRCFVAEHIASKLDEIKFSLFELKLERPCVSICTQTEKIETKVSRPLAAKGKFPCRLGKCTFYEGYSRMLNHLRYCHKDRLCESPSVDGKYYSRQWEMDHISNIEFDLAFFIPQMGIFFLISFIDASGNFMGNVQMVHTNDIAKEFNYKLEIKGNHRSSSFEGIPRSCRTTTSAAYQNSLHISSEDMRRMAKKETNKITCGFTLTREVKKNVPDKKTPK